MINMIASTPKSSVDQQGWVLPAQSGPSGTAHRWHRMAVLPLLFLALATMGCTPIRGIREYITYNDPAQDFVLGWRNQVWAKQAWHERRGTHTDHPYFRALREGFRAGYRDVASGGNGCPPAIPPRKYWTWKYQTPEGQAKVAAWFEGFPYGAKAAEQDGAGLWSEIQVSQQIRTQYSPSFSKGRTSREGTPDRVNELGQPNSDAKFSTRGQLRDDDSAEPLLPIPMSTPIPKSGNPRFQLFGGHPASKTAESYPASPVVYEANGVPQPPVNANAAAVGLQNQGNRVYEASPQRFQLEQ